MPNQATTSVIEDLKKAGFDMSNIEQQIKSNPLLDKQADSIIGGGVLRRQEFTNYKENLDKEAETLRNQVRELAANQDNLKNFEGNDQLYAAALEIIETQRENLINAGFDPEDVKNLSFKTEEGLKKATTKADQIDKENLREERKEMPDDKNYVTADEMGTVLGNVAGGVMAGGLRAQHQIRRAEQLGIEVTDAKVAEFEKNLLNGLKSNKSYEQIADETFGISAALEAKKKKETDDYIDSEVRRRTAETLKDLNIDPSRTTTQRRGLVSNLRQRQFADAKDGDLGIEGEGGTKNIGGKKVPVNKTGDIEFYKLRGDKSSRMQNAQAELSDLTEKHGDIFELIQ